MRITLLLIVIVANLSACTNNDNVPSGILSKDKMQAVLWDVFQAESYTGSVIKNDSSKNPVKEDAKLQEEIFKLHHISKDDFYKSYNYYKEHPGLLLTVLDSITVQENKNENNRLAMQAKIKARQDSIKAKATTLHGVDSILQKQKQNHLIADTVKAKSKPPMHPINYLKHKKIPA